MITDELVEAALAIASPGRDVVEGDDATWQAELPTMATMRAALEAVAPMIRAEVLEEAEKVAAYGAQRAYRDFHDRKLAEGAQVMAVEIAAAIRAMKGASHE